MADHNGLQMVHIGDPMQIAAPDQHHNPVEPPYHQPQLMTADQHLTDMIWEEIDGPRRESNSFTAHWSAGLSQYQRLLDISRHLRNEHARVTGGNNDLKVQSMNTRAETRTAISALERNLEQAQRRGDEASSQRIGVQRQLDDRQGDLEVSAAVVADLTGQNEVLKTQIKDFETVTQEDQRAKQSAAEEIAQLKEQKTKWEEDVKELQAREQTALETSARLQTDYENVTKEKQQLQDAFDQAAKSHQEHLTRTEGERADHIHQLKVEHLEEVDKVKLDCEEAHREQVNLSTLNYAKIMKQKDTDKAAAVKELQDSCDKLKQDQKTSSKTLRTAQNQLEASESEVSKLRADLRKLRQELDNSKTDLADEKMKVTAAEKKYSEERDYANRQNTRFHADRATWEQEKADASKDSKKQAVNMQKLRTEIQSLKERLETAEKDTKALTAEKAQAEEISDGLRSKLLQQEAATAEQAKKLAEMAEQARRWRRFEQFVEMEKKDDCQDDLIGTMSPPVSPVAPSGSEGNCENLLSASSKRVPSNPACSSRPVPAPAITVGGASKKRPAQPSASYTTLPRKIPRSSFKGRR
jgi:chromosome segregation ATPase